MVVIQRDERLAYRPYDTKTSERSPWVDAVAFKQRSPHHTSRPVTSGPKHSNSNRYIVMAEALPVHGGQEVDCSVHDSAARHLHGCCRPVGKSVDKLKCEEKDWSDIVHTYHQKLVSNGVKACRWTWKCINTRFQCIRPKLTLIFKIHFLRCQVISLVQKQNPNW